MIRRVALPAAALAAVSLIVVGVTGFQLADRYRPIGGPLDLLPSSLRRVETLRDQHVVATMTAVVASAVALGAVLWQRRTLLVAGGALAFVAALAIGITSGGEVGWEQVALERVRADTDYFGIWTAAFHDDVLFVRRDGAELEQRAYASSVVAHAAAVPALLVVATGAVLTARRIVHKPLTKQ